MKVGDVMVVKAGVTKQTSTYGNYQAGDICTITELGPQYYAGGAEVDCSGVVRVDFNNDRKEYIVNIDELRPLTKLEKAMQ